MTNENPYRAPQAAANNDAYDQSRTGAERRKRSLYSTVLLVLAILGIAIVAYDWFCVQFIIGR